MKKYKLFIDCILVLLCLFPLIALLFCFDTSSSFILNNDYCAFIEKFSISSTISNDLYNALNNVGFNLDGPYSLAVCVILSNSILIYMFYVFVEVLIFVPKMAIKLLRIGSRKDV